MIELPEARTIARDLRKEILGKTVVSVGGCFTGHKFTFYHGDPEQYNGQIAGKKITSITDRNFYIEIVIEDYILIMRDGVNIRYYNHGQAHPEKSKLLLVFDDGSFINVTVSMYAFIGICKNDGNIDNEYYALEVNGVGALDEKFTFDYFKGLINEKTLKLSVKAFLATGQRILGIGNGVVQDILYNAGFHPKRKMNTLSETEIEALYNAVINTLSEMTAQNGRDTEKTIYGTGGDYKTILSSKSYKYPCLKCGAGIKKEQYLGGSIYYCPNCQPA